MTPCPYCGAPRRNPLYPTCGAPACRLAHRRAKKRRSAKLRRDTLRAEGLCPRCGRKAAKRRSKTTGQPVTHCAGCLLDAAVDGRERTKTSKAERERLAAAARLADAVIERRRAQEARLAAGLPVSLAPNPKVPKSTPLPEVEI